MRHLQVIVISVTKVMIGREVERTIAGSAGGDADEAPRGFRHFYMQSLSPREREKARNQQILTNGKKDNPMSEVRFTLFKDLSDNPSKNESLV